MLSSNLGIIYWCRCEGPPQTSPLVPPTVVLFNDMALRGMWPYCSHVTTLSRPDLLGRGVGGAPSQVWISYPTTMLSAFFKVNSQVFHYTVPFLGSGLFSAVMCVVRWREVAHLFPLPSPWNYMDPKLWTCPRGPNQLAPCCARFPQCEDLNLY